MGRREVRRWGQRYPCSENFENLNILYFQVHFETLSGQVNCQLQAILQSVSFLNLHTRKNHLQPRKWSSSNGNILLQLFNQNCRKKVEKWHDVTVTYWDDVTLTTSSWVLGTCSVIKQSYSKSVTRGIFRRSHLYLKRVKCKNSNKRYGLDYLTPWRLKWAETSAAKSTLISHCRRVIWKSFTQLIDISIQLKYLHCGSFSPSTSDLKALSN